MLNSVLTRLPKWNTDYIEQANLRKTIIEPREKKQELELYETIVNNINLLLDNSELYKKAVYNSGDDQNILDYQGMIEAINKFMTNNRRYLELIETINKLDEEEKTKELLKANISNKLMRTQNINEDKIILDSFESQINSEYNINYQIKIDDIKGDFKNNNYISKSERKYSSTFYDDSYYQITDGKQSGYIKLNPKKILDYTTLDYDIINADYNFSIQRELGSNPIQLNIFKTTRIYRTFINDTYKINVNSEMIETAFELDYSPVFNSFFASLFFIMDNKMIEHIEKGGICTILPFINVYDKAFPGTDPEFYPYPTKRFDRTNVDIFRMYNADPNVATKKLINIMTSKNAAKSSLYKVLTTAAIENIKTDFTATEIDLSTIFNRDVDVYFKYEINIAYTEIGYSSPTGLCFFEALIEGYKYCTGSRLTEEEIANRLEIDIEPQPISSFQRFVDEYNINVFIANDKNKSHIHKKSPNAKHTIYILFHELNNEMHFCFMTKDALNKYYKKDCRKTIEDDNKEYCTLCRDIHGEEKLPEPVYCDKCNITYPSKTCHKLHKKICKTRIKCDECNVIYDTSKSHKCFAEYCLNCKKEVSEDHKCFIKTPKKKVINNKVFYADFETVLQGENKSHVVNYWFMQTTEEKRIVDYSGENIESFFETIAKPEFKNSYLIFHNMRGYDGILMLEYMTKKGMQYDVIRNGCKIVALTTRRNNIKLFDSYAHISIPLSGFTDSFGIKEIKKGYFPHSFNLPENINYIGPIPDIKYYDPDNFKTNESKNEFIKWYNEQKDKPYNFKEELIGYCKNDVVLLREGFTKYREGMIKLMEYDPLNNLTIASCAMDVFLTKFCSEKIALVDTNEYKFKEDKANSILAIHAKKTKEQQKTFLSCYKIGCKSCFNGNTVCSRRRRTMFDIFNHEYINDTDLHKNMKDYVFEHDFDKKLDGGEYIRDEYEEFKIDMLNPQDAVYGGRTETFKFYHKVDENEMIIDEDINSSYPAQMNNKKLPTGFHKVITEFENTDISNYFGLIKCTLLPPKNLNIPVIGIRANNKFMFSLCRTCSIEENKNVCNHSVSQRKIYGTFNSEEVKLAVREGYKVVKLYEVHHFDDSQTSTTLFKEYVTKLYQLKQEKAGWPKFVTSTATQSGSKTEEQKKKYCEKYNLRYNEVEDNPTMKSIAKLFLNSLYGKFGENPNRNIKTSVIYDPNKMADFIFNDKTLINNIKVSDNCMEIQTKNRSGFYFPKKSTNVYIASFITAYGRIQLYERMKKLQDFGCEILYCDTDSAIYVKKKSLQLPTDDIDDFEIGKWKVETDKIEEFVSLGPKTYSFKAPMEDKEKNKYVNKCKGFSLNLGNRISINFDIYKDILDKKVDSTSIKSVLFKKGKCIDGIKSVDMMKKLSFVFTKRKVLEGYKTAPF